MDKLGKLINNNLVYAPNKVEYKDKTIFNPSNEILKELGYKEVIEEEKPKIKEYQYLTRNYIETNVITISYIINNIDYDEAVNDEIRKKYTESQEFAILRQKEEKPVEYKEYYDYCEECKATIKEKLTQQQK